MIASRVKFASCMAALVVLWGCETPPRSIETPSTKNDMPVGQFFRTAAETSQNRFDYQSAAKYYQNLYNRDPDDMAALLGLARNFRYIGSAAQSVALLEEALPENPGIFALQAEYGKSLVAAGRGRKAIDYLEELIEEVPDDWELLSALGIAYDLLSESENAERVYRLALEIAPGNSSIINNLALSLALSNNIDEGIELLESTISTGFSTPHLRQNLALMFAMKGDIETARQLAERDLPQEMVANNIKYYERYFSRAGAAQSSGSTTSGTVEVSRLEEPAVTEEEPVIIPALARQTDQEPEATVTMAAVEQAVDTDQAAGKVYQSIDGIKIQLGVFKTFDRATAGLSAMRDGNVDLLSGLRFVIDEIKGIDAPVGDKVLAGPMASRQLAADLCTKLHSRKKVCRLVLP